MLNRSVSNCYMRAMDADDRGPSQRDDTETRRCFIK